MNHARCLACLGIFPVDAALANIGRSQLPALQGILLQVFVESSSDSASKIVNSREIGLVLGRTLDIHHATTGVKSSRKIDENKFGRRNVLKIEGS